MTRALLDYLAACLAARTEPDYRRVCAITGVTGLEADRLVQQAYAHIARQQVSGWRHERKSQETRRRIGAGVRRAREVGVLEFEEGRAA